MKLLELIKLLAEIVIHVAVFIAISLVDIITPDKVKICSRIATNNPRHWGTANFFLSLTNLPSWYTMGGTKTNLTNMANAARLSANMTLLFWILLKLLRKFK